MIVVFNDLDPASVACYNNDAMKLEPDQAKQVKEAYELVSKSEEIIQGLKLSMGSAGTQVLGESLSRAKTILLEWVKQNPH